MPRNFESSAPAFNHEDNQQDFDQWENELSSERQEISPMAERIKNAASRVANVLNTRAINKLHSEAHQENSVRDAANFAQQTQEQNEAFATYDSNVQTTADRESLESDWTQAQNEHREEQHAEALLLNKDFDKATRKENRAEKITNAKDAVSYWGLVALEGVKKGWSASKSGAETTALFAMISKDKIMAAAQKAEVRFAERAAHKENDDRNREAQNSAFDSYEDNVAYSEARQAQNDAFDSYSENVNYADTYDEAASINTQKKSAQEAAYDSYSSNIDATAKRESQEAAYDSYEDNIDYAEAHTEAIEENEAFDEARQNAANIARAARVRKIARRNARQEKISQASEWAGQTKVGRIGKAIGRFARRTTSAVAAGTRAAKASYQESVA